jgi:glutamine synthetase
VHNPDGTPFEGCPRNVLRVMMRRAEEMATQMMAGPEAEFFLFERDADGGITTRPMTRPATSTRPRSTAPRTAAT